MDLAESYEQNVGRPPANLPDDHPYKWQWEYRGTKTEKERLQAMLNGDPLPEDEPVLIEGQEELF